MERQNVRWRTPPPNLPDTFRTLSALMENTRHTRCSGLCPVANLAGREPFCRFHPREPAGFW